MPTNKKEGIIFGTIMCFLMVLGMVTFMSMFGIIIEGGIPSNLASVYVHTWIMNLMMALPLQLIIVGPISRTILGRIQTN